MRLPDYPRRMPLILAMVSLAFWPPTSRDRTTPPMEGTVDTRIQPGDDFFAYANGAWLRAAAIPAGKDRWSVRDEINDLTRRQVAAILDDASASPTGSLARKVADFCAALQNSSAIEEKGITPLAPLLARIDRVGDRLALTRLLGSSMLADVDPLNFGVYNSASVLGLSVEHSIHGETAYSAFLVQGGLGLVDRDPYLSIEQRRRYRTYVARMLALAGFDRADQRAESVLALETALAESHATNEASAVDRSADNAWSRADFAREAPGMDWNA